LPEVIAASALLADDWGIGSDIWSVTSFSELSREAREVERWNRLHPSADSRESHVEHSLAGASIVVAATDYVRAYPQLIAPYVEGRYVTLGTDGFGRSDTRAALRRFFEVDRYQIVIATLQALGSRLNWPTR
jgi:pyruvate dehydrogenase E1 component